MIKQYNEVAADKLLHTLRSFPATAEVKEAIQCIEDMRAEIDALRQPQSKIILPTSVKS